MSGGDLPDFASRVRGRARFIGVNVAATTLAALALSFLLPKWYTARAVLLPPTEEEMGLSLSQFVPKALGSIRVPGAPTLADLFVSVLRSRTVGDRILDRFDLVKRYRAPDREKALKELHRHCGFNVAEEGTIHVSVEDRDPRVAASMANAFLEELDRFNRVTRTTSAQRTRRFIEDRLDLARRDLAGAEDRMREYQQRKNMAAISPAARSEAEVGARLMAQKIALQVKLNVLRQSLAPTSEEVRRVQEELGAIEREVGSLPQTGVETMRLWRDVRVQEQVFELLTAQLEEARIREARDNPTVQVLDAAVPPLHKSRPKRAWITLAGFALGLGGSLTLLLLERRRPEPPPA